MTVGCVAEAGVVLLLGARRLKLGGMLFGCICHAAEEGCAKG